MIMLMMMINIIISIITSKEHSTLAMVRHIATNNGVQNIDTKICKNMTFNLLPKNVWLSANRIET